MQALGDRFVPDEVRWSEDDPRWQLMLRILASPDFLRSPRLCEFLRYVTQKTLDGQASLLSEQHIGEAQFGRAASYDSAADTIVRSHALRLRRRLQQYFERHGATEPIWLEIPRGSYSVTFSPAPPPPFAGCIVDAVAQIAEAPPMAGFKGTDFHLPEETFGQPLVRSLVQPGPARRLKTSAALLAITAALLIAALHLRADRARASAPLHPLWSELFTPDRPTRVVLGDSGLVLFHAATRQYVSLGDYLHKNYDSQLTHLQHVDPDFARFLIGRRYTSMVDAEALLRLNRLPEASADRTLVQYARDMRLDDFKYGNLILLGAQESDPWVELFEHSMDFVFLGPTDTRAAAFLNRRPRPGEPASYSMVTGSADPTVYAVIALLPNLNASGNVLLLEGVNMAGTEGALDFVLDDSRLLAVLSRIRRPNGSLPHFELLLKTSTLTDNAVPASVVAIHVHAD
jgi:hypothetical protein